MLLLKTETDLERADLERAASIIEEASMQKAACFVLRQHEDDERNVKVCCVPSAELGATLKALEEEGFTSGPKASEEVMLKEGREMMLHFKGNVVEVNNTEPKMKFLYYRKTRCSFKVKEVDEFAQRSLERFKGKVLVTLIPLENDISLFNITSDGHSKRDKRHNNDNDLYKLVELDLQISKVREINV